MPTKSYEEVMAERLGELSPEDQAVRAVFERGYKIALQIIDLREKRGMTQVQLAQLTGIDQADISRIERGSVYPNEKTLIRIAEALGAELQLVERASA